MRSFASDNNSGVHPEVMEAILAANTDPCGRVRRRPVGPSGPPRASGAYSVPRRGPSFCSTAREPNSVALQAVTRSFNSIICATTGPYLCGRVQCAGPHDRLPADRRADARRPADARSDPAPICTISVDCHHAQPGAVYLAQATELGTIYTPEEIRAIADLIHGHGMKLHMDGARLANACAALGCTMREATVDARGGHSEPRRHQERHDDGGGGGCFRRGACPPTSSTTASSRPSWPPRCAYLSAQFVPYLESGLWLRNAEHAQPAGAAAGHGGWRALPHVELTQPVDTNQIFLSVPEEGDRTAGRALFLLRVERGDARSAVRYVVGYHRRGYRRAW